jgi:hypothetical protein
MSPTEEDDWNASHEEHLSSTRPVMRFQLDNEPVAEVPLHYTDCGLDNVWLLSGFAIERDPRFGELISIQHEDDLLRAIALRLINQSATGAEARFLRKLIGPTVFWQIEKIG